MNGIGRAFKAKEQGEERHKNVRPHGGTVVSMVWKNQYCKVSSSLELTYKFHTVSIKIPIGLFFFFFFFWWKVVC